MLAAGGLSYPTLGTDGTVHRLLAALGHRLAPPYPALTPLLGPHPGGSQLAGAAVSSLLLICMHTMFECGRPGVQLTLKALEMGASQNGRKWRQHVALRLLPSIDSAAGVSLSEVTLSARPAAKGRKAAAAAQRRAMLFTHRGFSGPAVLDLSHHAVMAAERRQLPPGARSGPKLFKCLAWQQLMCELESGRQGLHWSMGSILAAGRVCSVSPQCCRSHGLGRLPRPGSSVWQKAAAPASGSCSAVTASQHGARMSSRAISFLI